MSYIRFLPQSIVFSFFWAKRLLSGATNGIKAPQLSWIPQSLKLMWSVFTSKPVDFGIFCFFQGWLKWLERSYTAMYGYLPQTWRLFVEFSQVFCGLNHRFLPEVAGVQYGPRYRQVQGHCLGAAVLIGKGGEGKACHRGFIPPGRSLTSAKCSS